ncbi:MAG: hypothetical protein NZ870_04285, partial [bacterium]|nr:hypothetical protein [bacterium]
MTKSTEGKKKVVHIITRLETGGSSENTILTCLGLKDKYDVYLIFGGKKIDLDIKTIHIPEL